jgi:hypothetical protein
MKERPMELNYKRAFFIYLNVMAFLIMFTNDLKIMKIVPMSVFALLIHGVYIGVLVYINPYKMSLRIHTVGLFTCQAVYGLFLVFINLVNFLDEMDDIGVLLIAYLILGCSGFIIVFKIMRLYYEYKYGEELERQIQK